MSTALLRADPSELAQRWGEPVGRAGLAARGVIYVLVGILAGQVGTGDRAAGGTDSRGALAELAGKPFGSVALVALAIGFGAYALWRLVRALVGEEPGDPPVRQRLADLAKAALYVALLVSTIGLLRGHGSSDPSQTWTARLMALGWGRWVVGAGGLAVAGAGIWYVVRAVDGRIGKHLERAPGWLLRLGRVAHIGRGAALVIVGGWVVRAAVRFDPSEPVGLDGALRELAGSAIGTAVILAVAVGLLAFGSFSLAEARHRRVLDA